MLCFAIVSCIETVCTTMDELLVNTATIDLDRADIKIQARPSHLYSVSHSLDTSDPKKLDLLQFQCFPTGPC